MNQSTLVLQEGALNSSPLRISLVTWLPLHLYVWDQVIYREQSAWSTRSRSAQTIHLVLSRVVVISVVTVDIVIAR